MSKALILLLFALLLPAGCGDAPQEIGSLIRLARPERIAAVDSEHRDVLEGRTDLLERNRSMVRIGPLEAWFPFYTAIEMGTAPADELPALTEAPLSEGRERVRIMPGTGIAHVTRVQGGGEVFLRCKGLFTPDSGCAAMVVALGACPEAPPSRSPGALRSFIERYQWGGIGSHLQPSEDGRSASGIVAVPEDVKKLLIMVAAWEKEEGFLEAVDVIPLTPGNIFLRRRMAAGIPHPALATAAFVEGTLRPSLLLPPRTAVTMKAFPIPRHTELRLALAVVDGKGTPLEFVVTALPEAGGEREPGDGPEDGGEREQGEEREDGDEMVILREVLTGDRRDWIERRVDLSGLAGRNLSLRFACRPAEGAAMDPAAIPPLVCCGAPVLYPTGPPPEAGGFNLVLISIDTLRWDHLGCSGYGRPVSPNMDRFAGENILFERFYAHAPYTLPSHASLFTSLYPPVHGAYFDQDALPEGAVTLAEVLARRGFATASFNNGGFVSHEFGFHRGFDLYCEVEPLGDRYLDGKPVYNHLRFADGSAGSLDRALAWIDSVASRRFFIFLHTFMVHDYMPPRDLAERFDAGPGAVPPSPGGVKNRFGPLHVKEHGLSGEDLAFRINRYDATIAAADRMVGEVLEHLSGRGLLERTVVVITSDHGEEFMDHGSVLHGKTVYEELIRVPFMMGIPGMSGPVRVKSQVNQVDVLPTLLEALDVPLPEKLQGRSLLPLVLGEESGDRTVFAETRYPAYASMDGILEDGWKYIEGSTDPSLHFPAPCPAELYRLADDPEERRNLVDRRPETARAFKERIEEVRRSLGLAREAMRLHTGSRRSVSEELRNMLRQQGYF